MLKNNIGAWIFLSVLLVVITAVGIFLYADAKITQRDKEAAIEQQKREQEKKQREYIEDLKNPSSCHVTNEHPYTKECDL